MTYYIVNVIVKAPKLGTPIGVISAPRCTAQQFSLTVFLDTGTSYDIVPRYWTR